MDINMVRAAITVLAFVSFLGIVWWAWHRKSSSRFDEAARLPFADTVPGRQSSERQR